ncbi:hypothetical protein F5I97DRAFT_1928450 [Phlebopus sp. FC_14]|nr:hypothetical protein F5I97DRAFT_1928450 [Phlebopus sp. FC_14]
MNSTSTTSSFPSLTELENMGVLFVGFVVATVLYGFTFFRASAKIRNRPKVVLIDAETYIYYFQYPRDSRWLKYLVTALSTLDTAVSAIGESTLSTQSTLISAVFAVSEVLYYYLIIMFDVNMDILYATTTFCVQYVLSIVLTFMSQMFFVHRVYAVSGKRLVTLIVAFLFFTSFGKGSHVNCALDLDDTRADTVFGLTSAGQMFEQRQLSALASPNMRFVTAPSKQLWVPFQMVACKVYVNTVLGSLNARPVKHGHGVYEEDITTRTDLSSERGLPSTLHFKADTRATQQLTNFTASTGDLESGVSEVKGPQTVEESGFRSVQVASQSTQSQTSMIIYS